MTCEYEVNIFYKTECSCCPTFEHVTVQKTNKKKIEERETTWDLFVQQNAFVIVEGKISCGIKTPLSGPDCLYNYTKRMKSY